MHLKTGDVETDPAASVTEIASPLPGRAGHLLLHFPRHPTAAMVSELRRDGVQVLGDVPDNGLLVKVAQPTAVAALGVNYAAPISPRNKISPLIASSIAPLLGKRAIRGRGAQVQSYFIVEFHSDTDMNRARGTLLNMGLIPLDNPDLNPSHLMFHVGAKRAPAALAALAQLDEVAYVFPASRELILNIPARYYAGALTTNGPAGQSIPTYGNGWDGPGLGAATVVYVFSRMTAQLGSAAAQTEIRRAMAEWSRVAAISWQPGGSAFGSATVNVLFAAYDHGDGYPFDGPGGIVAHTFYPAPPNPEPIAGDMHFDDSESWHIGVNTDRVQRGAARTRSRARAGAFRRSHCRHVSLLQNGHDFGCARRGCDPDALRRANFGHYRPACGSPYDASAHTSSGPGGERSSFHDYGVEHQPVGIGGRRHRRHRGDVVFERWRFRDRCGTCIRLEHRQCSAGNRREHASSSPRPLRRASISQSVTITRQSVTTTGSGGGSGGGSPDTTAPALTITTPSTGTMSTTAASVTIAGAASDNVGVTLVSWATNFGTAGVATGTTAWSAAIPLLVGNNSVTVRAVDAAGNSGWRSVVITRH